MEYRAVEVKAGRNDGKRPMVVDIDEVFQITRISLGPPVVASSDEEVILSVIEGEEEFVLGRLTTSRPSIGVDLVFHQDFTLVHNRKNGSVFFSGFSEYTIENEG